MQSEILNIHRGTKKIQANLFLSELPQSYTDFDTLWHKDGQDDTITCMRDTIASHLTLFVPTHYRVKRINVPNCYITQL